MSPFLNRRFRRSINLWLILTIATPQMACTSNALVYKLSGEHNSMLPLHSRVSSEPTIMALAHDLDQLEGYLDKYGSVVAKQPDVWGQARLTKYREEFEKVMEIEKDSFEPTLQGSLARSDQAYFADAAALSAAVSSQGAFLRPPDRVVVANASASNAQSPERIKPETLPSPSDEFAAFGTNGLIRSGPQSSPTLGFATAEGKGGIQLEPALFLDQKARYLNHLHELRRINEGDDTADSPGYSLNLVRIPISVLPGKNTGMGYGAEVSMTLAPYLSEELLPTTFRNLVLNDLVDQVGFTVTHFINNPENSDYLSAENAGDLEDLFHFAESNSVDRIVTNQVLIKNLRELGGRPGLQKIILRQEWDWVRQILRQAGPMNKQGEEDLPKLGPQADELHASPEQEEITPFGKKPDPVKNMVIGQGMDAYAKGIWLNRVKSLKLESVRIIQGSMPIPVAKSRRARQPFPPSEMVDVYGFDFVYHLATDAYRGLSQERFARPCTDIDQVYLHLPDMQGYLQEELGAAQKFLSTPTAAPLWRYCNPELVNAIRTHDAQKIGVMRRQFRNSLVEHGSPDPHSTVAALAWATIVESALLTDQLIQDMRESSASRKAAPLPDAWLPYYLPCPPPEARAAFNDYVRCRWPIHVFALDPVAQQQNLADVFSGRREMQLSMSLAFLSGQISARNMMRYARRLEYDFATIDVNGTSVGFSHGENNFGWRFYPRFQTPDIESNAKVFLRDQLIGGPNRNALLQQRRLEPGMRECVALVMMPSFVPHATLNVSSGWFKLTNPECRELDSTKAMQLSQQVRAIQDFGPNVADADRFRAGAHESLLQKAKQLEARLPFQQQVVQVPYENTLGGFAMFNTGVTDLAPELTGWYGAPAINTEGSTTMFLVGNHFSVHQTSIIAGGKAVVSREMLSRQVMKVVIPPGAAKVGNANHQFVDIHVATPYGVTQHMLVPVCAGPPAKGGPGLAWAKDVFEVAFVYSGLGIAPPLAEPRFRPPSLSISRPADVPEALDELSVKLKLGDNEIEIIGKINAKGSYNFPGEDLAKELFAKFGERFGPEATNAPYSLAAKGTATFRSAKNKVDSISRETQPLIINWIKAAGARLGNPVKP